MRAWTCGAVGVVVMLVTVGGGCAARPRPVPRPPAVAVPAGPAAEGAGGFADAYARYRAGDLSAAQTQFRALVATDPTLADYNLYFLGMSAGAAGGGEAAAAAFRAVIERYPDSVVRPDAQLELGRRALSAGRFDDALMLLQGAASAPRRQTARAARLALGETREATGDAAGAAAEYMAVRRATPGSAAAQTAKRRLLALRAAHPELEPTGDAVLAEARLCLAEGDATGAERWAARAAVASRGRARDVAVRVQAEALVRQQRTDEGVALLREIAARDPMGPEAPAALVRAATVLWNRDRDAEAGALFEEVVRRYPRDARAGEALYAVGRIEQAAGRQDAAIAAFTRLATAYPTGAQAADARWRVGWIYYGAGNWRAAADAFGAAAAGETESSGRYWQARALERSGDRAGAAELYRRVIERAPDGYYAMWAEVRLAGASALPDIATPVSAPATAPVDPPPPSPAAFAPADRFHADRWFALRQAGVNDLARGELDAVRRANGNDPSTAALLVPAYAAVDGYSAALDLLREPAAAAGLSADQRRRLQYPLAYWQTVRPAAATRGVDPLLVVAIMRQESRFDADARSPADAYGLLQLLPSTAERIAARDPSLPRPDADRLTDPAVNIPIAVAYLAILLDDFDGDVLKATAAYNGGEAAVARWEQRFPGLPPDEFVESITYRETRDYVKRVVGNYRAYRALWGGRD